MRVIQISIEDALLAALENRLRQSGTPRSAFVRDAVARELRRLEIEELERRHREGYERFPVEPGEFDVEADTENWPDR